MSSFIYGEASAGPSSATSLSSSSSALSGLDFSHSLADFTVSAATSGILPKVVTEMPSSSTSSLAELSVSRLSQPHFSSSAFLIMPAESTASSSVSGRLSLEGVLSLSSSSHASSAFSPTPPPTLLNTCVCGKNAAVVTCFDCCLLYCYSCFNNVRLKCGEEGHTVLYGLDTSEDVIRVDPLVWPMHYRRSLVAPKHDSTVEFRRSYKMPIENVHQADSALNAFIENVTPHHNLVWLGSPRLINSVPGSSVAIHGWPRSVSFDIHRPRQWNLPLISFALGGATAGKVSKPWGFCTDKNGQFIVADRRNNRVQIFNSEGAFVRMFGSKGSGPGQFDLPAGISTDPQDRIVVVDKDNHRVQIFSADGTFILLFGSQGSLKGQFQYPWDVAVNSLGNIIVADSKNNRLQMFDSQGLFIRSLNLFKFSLIYLQYPLSSPRGVTFTPSGNIVVSDFINHRVVLVNSELDKVIKCVGGEGCGRDYFNRPSGMACDDEGTVVVADSKNCRVVIMNPNFAVEQVYDFSHLKQTVRPCDVALTPDGSLAVMLETLPDATAQASDATRNHILVF